MHHCKSMLIHNTYMKSLENNPLSPHHHPPTCIPAPPDPICSLQSKSVTSLFCTVLNVVFETAGNTNVDTASPASSTIIGLRASKTGVRCQSLDQHIFKLGPILSFISLHLELWPECHFASVYTQLCY